MLYYEDEEINVTGNSSDIKYDAEVMDSFTDALASDIDRYKARARALEKEYVRYHNNETFVGQMAEDSKRFIYEVQGDKLHDKNLDLKKEFLNLCLRIENKFKEEVDPSPKARVSMQTLSKIKKDFNVINSVADTAGYELDCCAKEVINIAGKWGVSTLPNFRRTVEALDEFCGHGKMLDKDIRKLENYDREACAIIDRKDLTGYADDLQRSIKYTAGVLDSMTVYQPNVTKNSVGVISTGIGATLNSISTTLGMMASDKISLVSPRDTTKKPRRWSLVKKRFTIDNVKANASKNNAKYIESMKAIYGFTQEEAELLNEAYLKHCENCEGIEKMSNRERANSFYTALACLYSQYSAKSIQFRAMGSNKMSPDEAVSYFNSIGVDGEKLREMVKRQHDSCAKKELRDFVHECAIYSVMTNDNIVTIGASLDDNVGDLVGFKGDVYSGSMGMDDVKSDIAAYNIYYRMEKCEDGDVWNAMVEYNIDTYEGTTNESKEFLQNMGYGNPYVGMSLLKEKLYNDTELARTITIAAEYHADVDESMIERERIKFLDYVSKKSGIAIIE